MEALEHLALLGSKLIQMSSSSAPYRNIHHCCHVPHVGLVDIVLDGFGQQWLSNRATGEEVVLEAAADVWQLGFDEEGPLRDPRCLVPP